MFSSPNDAAGASVAGRVARGIADGLHFAAAPAFAVMALLSVSSGNADMACMAAPHTMPLGGMTLMYGLMSAFHSAPWLKRIATRMTVAS